MKLNQLRAFIAVAEYRSIRRASRALYLSQPAVTKTIRELEASLDAPLIERSVKGIELTACGEAFLDRARLLVTEMRRASEEVRHIHNGVAGSVSIAVSAFVALTILHDAFSSFRRQAPAAELTISEGARASELVRLRDGSLDFMIVHQLRDVELSEDSEFSTIELFRVPLAVCVRDEHPLAGASSLAELEQAEWLLPVNRAEDDPMVRAIFHDNGLRGPRQLVHCPSFTVALGLIANTDVVSVFGEPLVELELKRHGLRSLDIREPLPSVRVALMLRKDGRLSPTASRLMECLMDAAKKFSLVNRLA